MLAENRFCERKINARNATITAKETHLNLGKILTKKKVASNDVCTYHMIKVMNSSYLLGIKRMLSAVTFCYHL